MTPPLQIVAWKLLVCEIGLHEAERCLRDAMMREALRFTKGNRTNAAKMLGIHRNTLLRLIPKAERGSQPIELAVKSEHKEAGVNQERE